MHIVLKECLVGAGVVLTIDRGERIDLVGQGAEVVVVTDLLVAVVEEPLGEECRHILRQYHIVVELCHGGHTVVQHISSGDRDRVSL